MRTDSGPNGSYIGQVTGDFWGNVYSIEMEGDTKVQPEQVALQSQGLYRITKPLSFM